MKVVVIDAGHGGRDSGASGNGYVEKRETLKEALKLRSILEDRYVVKTVLTRNRDVYVGVNDRAKETNKIAIKYGVDNVAFISLHWNSSRNNAAHGYEMWVNFPNTKGEKLAKLIMREVSPVLPNTNRGIKYSKGNLAVLKSEPATVLMEGCFIPNPNDIRAYLGAQDRILEAYTRGIANYLNLKEKPRREALYRVQTGAYQKRDNADRLLEKMKEKGIHGFIKLNTKDDLYRVQTGAYKHKSNADNRLKVLNENGFDGFIVAEIKEDNPIPANQRSEYFMKGNTHIIKTIPDNIYIAHLGTNLARKGVNGINGTFFDTGTAKISNPESNVFIAVNGGKAISDNSQFNGWNGPPRGTIYYTKDGRLGNRKVKSVKELPDNVEWAIGGFTIKPYMDFKNERLSSSINYKTGHSYIGFDNKGYIYLISKPDHRPFEIAKLMEELNIVHAILLDGGGSTQMRYKTDKIYSRRSIASAVLLKSI